MSVEATEIDLPPAKGGRRGLIAGLALALLLGGGGFYAVWSGAILGPDEAHAATEDLIPGPLTGIAFVPVQPLVINLGEAGQNRHLRFQAELEVAKAAQGQVTQMLPRVVDVLNGYLRAVEMAEIEDPAALVRLRAQMLRRVQVVTGEGSVRDLLIIEFVLN